jgi:peroxin-5
MVLSSTLLFLIVLTTGLDLLDLSEPVSQTQTKAKKSEPSSKTSSLKKKADGSDLISTDAEQRGQPLRAPDTSSLDLGKVVVGSSHCSTFSCW